MNKSDLGDYPVILTAQDISQILKVSKPTAYEIMKYTDFPILEIGRCKRVLQIIFLNGYEGMEMNKTNVNKTGLFFNGFN